MLKPLLAAVAGAGAGFLYAKMRYEKAANAYAIERIEQAKVYAEERADRAIAKFQAEASAEVEKELVDRVAKVFEEKQEKTSSIFSEDPDVENLIVNYQGFGGSEAPMVAKEESESHIRLMRRKEFFEYDTEEGDYHQVAVTYYQNEDILYDDIGRKQLDVQAAVGNIRPSWFGHEADDENVCYVENSRTKIMFEVNRSQGSFAQDVGLSNNEDKAE